MTQLILKLKLLTPLLMFGAFNGSARGEPEIRVASIRGDLRYWLRTVYGAVYGSNIKGLYEAESRIFGSTSRGSAVTVRVEHKLTPHPNQNLKVLPTWLSSVGYNVTKSPTHSRGKTEQADFSIHLVSHPLRHDLFSPAFASALFLAFTLGGFGKRARRGGGALQIVEQSGDSLSDILNPINTANGAALAEELKKRFSQVQQVISNLSELRDKEENMEKKPYSATSTPTYPVFAPDHCRVFVGKKGEVDYLAALKQMWTLTKEYHLKYSVDESGNTILNEKKKPIPDEWAWGYTLNNGQIKRLDEALGNRDENRAKRRASALHMRVYQCEDGKYYPIISFFRNGQLQVNRQFPQDENQKWERVQEVVDLFDRDSHFERVYADTNTTQWS